MVRTEYGGHLGFMFHQKQEDETDITDISFMPAELARYIDYVSDARTNLKGPKIH
jgi:predicted alpha/beta-fold hydrolase